MMVGSTSSASNMHRVIDDTSDPYKNMVMDVMEMNQDHTSQCPIINEELNVDVTRFFDFLKDSDKPLWNNCRNHIKFSTII
jgi:hypothetical protein